MGRAVRLPQPATARRHEVEVSRPSMPAGFLERPIAAKPSRGIAGTAGNESATADVRLPETEMVRAPRRID